MPELNFVPNLKGEKNESLTTLERNAGPGIPGCRLRASGNADRRTCCI
jgi:hypothetical protein